MTRRCNAQAPSKIGHVLVVVPAHNERENISSAIDHITRACGLLPSRVSSSIVVVADACTDGTKAIALATAAVDHVAVITAQCVGTARRIGTEVGLASAPGRLADIWVASTDADSHVPADWLVSQVTLADSGAVGVAGIVQLRHDERFDEALDRRFASTYRLGKDGSHGHVHGANIAFRADAYRAVGGWRDLTSGEDHDLWGRLGTWGPLLSSTAIKVRTSVRRRGRAPRGFAHDLASLDGIVA